MPATKVFVMGAGVAGLQAIATARRLGAVVTATDVRPAAKEQVESLGAKFIAVMDEEFKQAETAAGYAKEMSKEYQARAGRAGRRARQEAGHRHHDRADSGAGRRRGWCRHEMVASMRPGSVIVDLAVERGGNVRGRQGRRPVADVGGVKIVGYRNMPAGSPPRHRASTPRTSMLSSKF